MSKELQKASHETIVADFGLDNEIKYQTVNLCVNCVRYAGKKLTEEEREVCEWLVDSSWRENRLKDGSLSNYWLQSWYNLLCFALEALGWKLCKYRAVDQEKFEFWKDWSRYFLSRLELVKIEANERRIQLRPAFIPDPKIGKPFLNHPLERRINLDYVPRKGRSWMKPKWQEDVYWCLVEKCDDIGRLIPCGWVGIGSDRKYHAQRRGHNRFKHIFPARLAFIPHYRIWCPSKCGLKYVPTWYEKDKGLSHCPNCKTELTSPSTYRDPADFGDRVCHDCAKVFDLNKYSWSSQGFFCPECLKKREDREKKRVTRRKRPP